MTDKYRRQVHNAPRFTALETRLMAALAHDLRQTVPDLAGQFQDARPGLRRNTAFGYYAETIVDRARPPVSLTLDSGPTGRFGTVHAMLAGLPEAVAFQVELLNGRLLGLHADSYGQDTRAIDFATVPVTEIFTLDASGRSIPYHAVTGYRPESPLRRLQRNPDPQPEPIIEPPRLVNVGPLQRVQDAGRPPDPAPAAARPRPATVSAPMTTPVTTPDEIPLDEASLKVGIWVMLGALAFIANLIFDLPFVAAAILVGVIGRAATSPKALPVIAEALKSWRARQNSPAGS